MHCEETGYIYGLGYIEVKPCTVMRYGTLKVKPCSMMTHDILKAQSILRVNPGIVMRQGLLGLHCFMRIRDIVRVQCILR